MANKPAILRVRDENGKIYDIPAIIGASAYDIAVKEGFKGTKREWLDSLIGGEIDNAMSDTSENPVRNFVIKQYIDKMLGDVESAISMLNNIIGGGSNVNPGNPDNTDEAMIMLLDDLDSMIGIYPNDPTEADDPTASAETSMSAIENITGV